MGGSALQSHEIFEPIILIVLGPAFNPMLCMEYHDGLQLLAPLTCLHQSFRLSTLIGVPQGIPILTLMIVKQSLGIGSFSPTWRHTRCQQPSNRPLLFRASDVRITV